MNITVDGALTTVDLYAASPQAQQIFFVKEGLAPGNHTIVVAPSGQKNAASSGYTVLVDALDVR